MEDLRLMNRTANLAERRRKPRAASSSSTSRYEREKRKYHPTASRMTSGSNCRHLNKPQTEEARRSIRPAYHGLPVKLQHCPFRAQSHGGRIPGFPLRSTPGYTAVAPSALKSAYPNPLRKRESIDQAYRLKSALSS